METVFLLCVDKALAQRLTAPSTLQGMEPLHVKDAAHLVTLKNSGKTPDVLFIGPGCPDPVRLVQSVHDIAGDAPILICRLPEEYDEVQRALQFAPMLAADITCTTVSDPFEVELQGAISRSRRRREVKAAINASNGLLASVPAKREVALRYIDRLLEAAPIGVLALDAENRLLDCNRRAAEMLGWPKESLTGRSLPALLSEGHWNAWRHALSEAIISAEEVVLSVPGNPAEIDGSHVWEIRAVSFQTDSGNPGVLCILLDITDLKLAEGERARSEMLLQLVIDNVPGLVSYLDPEMRYSFANRRYREWFSSTPSAGQRVLDLVGEEVFRRSLPHLRRALAGEEVTFEEFFPYSNGHSRHVEVTYSPDLRDGAVHGVVAMVQDITAQKHLEWELRHSKERLQQVFAQAPAAVAVFRGRDMVFELANSSYQGFYPGRELVGRRLRDATPEISADTFAVLQSVFDTGEPFVGREYLMPIDQNGDGIAEDAWFTFVYQPLRELNGQVTGVVLVAVDVTTHVRARQQLERVNRELEEFAYVASHDLQEPLRMVNIYTQLLLQGIGDQPRAQEYAGFVRQGVTRMETLIRDLLTYSRTVHEERLQVGEADLAAAFDEAQSVLKNRIEESGAIVTAQALPKVYGDTQQLAHVFENLLSNALKYRKQNAHANIRVTAELSAGRWTIAIRDNGIGFEPQYAERIFGLFKRLHTKEYAGTGLGLAICQRIIERYGGRIWAEGRPGDGATFFFTLKAAGRP